MRGFKRSMPEIAAKQWFPLRIKCLGLWPQQNLGCQQHLCRPSCPCKFKYKVEIRLKNRIKKKIMMKLIGHVRHCGLVGSAPALDGTGCEFDSCGIYIPCSLSLWLLGSLRVLWVHMAWHKNCVKNFFFLKTIRQPCFIVDLSKHWMCDKILTCQKQFGRKLSRDSFTDSNAIIISSIFFIDILDD